MTIQLERREPGSIPKFNKPWWLYGDPNQVFRMLTKLAWNDTNADTFLECPMDRVCCYILHPCPPLQLITAISQKLKFTWQIASWWWCLASLMSQISILRTHCLMVFCSRHFATSDSLICKNKSGAKAPAVHCLDGKNSRSRRFKYTLKSLPLRSSWFVFHESCATEKM